MSHFLLSSYQYAPLAKLRIGTINALNAIYQLLTSFRSLKYRSVIITSVMLIWNPYGVFSQINNDHPQISVSKETGQTQFNRQQLYSVQMYSKKLCFSDTPYRWDFQSSKTQIIQLHVAICKARDQGISALTHFPCKSNVTTLS